MTNKTQTETVKNIKNMSHINWIIKITNLNRILSKKHTFKILKLISKIFSMIIKMIIITNKETININMMISNNISNNNNLSGT